MTGREPPPAVPRGDPLVVIACREFVELVTEHLEGALPDELEKAVAAHLGLCDPCVEYLEQIQRTVGLLATLPTETLPAVVRNDLLGLYSRMHGASSAAD